MSIRNIFGLSQTFCEKNDEFRMNFCEEVGNRTMIDPDEHVTAELSGYKLHTCISHICHMFSVRLILTAVLSGQIPLITYTYVHVMYIIFSFRFLYRTHVHVLSIDMLRIRRKS